jgi:hypothetical protein
MLLGISPVSILAATIQSVYTHGAFETAGVIVTLAADNGNESVALEVKGPQDAGFRPVHPFVRYDLHNFAASLFNLQPNTLYDLRLTLTDPDDAAPRTQLAQVRTRSESSIPAPKRVRYVAPDGQDVASAGRSADKAYATITFAVTQAQAGDEIRVLPGYYGPVRITKRAVPGAPIVIRAADANQKPVIDGAGAGTAVNISASSDIVFDGFEIRHGGSDRAGIGVLLDFSARIALQNSYVHDNGYYNVLINHSANFPDGRTLGGYHLIQRNVIATTSAAGCRGASNNACPGQGYYGVLLDNNPGAGNVIRQNTIYGHVDDASVCGDESDGRNLGENTPHVLALTGKEGRWTNHNLDFYDNALSRARDDLIELDGICVNARIFRNRLGDMSNPAKDAQNAVSVAPVMPGPYFILRNLIAGNMGDSAIKFNTAGSDHIPSRNVYFYHNTVVRTNPGTLVNLWYAVPNDHNVPLKNVVFRNNVFWAKAGGQATHVFNRGTQHPSFSYDLWYSSSYVALFQWWDGRSVRTYSSLGAFQAGTGQELNGLFATPRLEADLRPAANSEAIDHGQRIPGINDGYTGAAPDLGAYELGDSVFRAGPAHMPDAPAP